MNTNIPNSMCIIDFRIILNILEESTKEKENVRLIAILKFSIDIFNRYYLRYF